MSSVPPKAPEVSNASGGGRLSPAVGLALAAGALFLGYVGLQIVSREGPRAGDPLVGAWECTGAEKDGVRVTQSIVLLPNQRYARQSLRVTTGASPLYTTEYETGWYAHDAGNLLVAPEVFTRSVSGTAVASPIDGASLRLRIAGLDATTLTLEDDARAPRCVHQRVASPAASASAP